MIWKDVTLSGNTAHGFAEQIGELEGFLAENWRAGISPTSGNPVYTRPIVLTIRREDHSFLLDPIMPRPGRVILPCLMSCGTIVLTVSTGTAKPMPAFAPDGE